MATNRKRTVVGSRIGDVVENAKRIAVAERSNRQAKMESEFQKAIADGLSYEDQVKFRQKQLEGEKVATFKDTDYISRLEKSVSDTKKLSRFSKYRTKYRDSLAKLNGGLINAQDQLDQVRNMLDGVEDPDLREEIIGDIADAETQAKSYRDTLVANKVKKAQYDGTTEVLQSALSDVRAARLDAQLFGRQDETEMYDQTIESLTGQLTTVRVADSIDDFRLDQATKGHTVNGKLGFLDARISASDAVTPVRIDNKLYGSEREFWQLQRDGYLNGGSELFGTFTDEVRTEVTNGLASDSARFGSPTQTSLDAVKAKFDAFASRPGLEQFIPALESVRADVMGRAADSLAATVVDRATASLDFKGADATLKNIETRYNVNVDTQRLKLEQNLLSIPDSAVSRTEKATLIPDNKDIVAPRIESPTAPAAVPEPEAPVDPKTPNYTGGSIVDYLRSGSQAADFNSRKKLAESHGIQNYVGNADQNNELLSVLRAGTKPKVETLAPAAPTPPAPVAPPVTSAEAVKKMATLVNKATGDRKAVEVDSPDAKSLFGQGYELET